MQAAMSFPAPPASRVAVGVGESVAVAVLVGVAVWVGVGVIVDVEMTVAGATTDVGEAFIEGIMASHPALRIARMPHETRSRSLLLALEEQGVFGREGAAPADPTTIVPR
jgi:hypothetical protein